MRSRSDTFLPKLQIPKSAGWVLGVGAVVVLCLSAWLSVQRNLDFAWTSIRLAPAFALVQGLPLYSTPDAPPWVMVGYGPLYPLAYLPSTFAGTPGPAVVLATLLAHLYILVPVALLCAMWATRLRQERAEARLHWSLLLLLFALVASVAPSLTYITTYVHVDAPALGLVLFASYAVLRVDAAARALPWLLTAGASAGLAVTCKINLAAAAVALVIWIALRSGVMAAVKFAAAAAVAFLVVYACAVAHDGAAAVLFNLRLPAKMPWLTNQELGTLALSGTSYDFADKLRTFLSLLSDYVQQYGVVALVLLLLLPALKARSASATQMILLFLFLAVVMLPASIASVGKSGGDVNSRALFTLPLTIAAVLAFGTLIDQANRTSIAAAYAGLLGLTFVVGLATAGGLLRLSITQSSTLTEAYEHVAAEPGRWYFPFDPLAHLLGERQMRPNMDVVHSYAAAGAPVKAEAFRSSLPANLEFIAVPPSFASWGVTEIQRTLPEYRRILRDQELQHHQVITR